MNISHETTNYNIQLRISFFYKVFFFLRKSIIHCLQYNKLMILKILQCIKIIKKKNVIINHYKKC